MKIYVKPALEYVKLTAEEKFANASTCVDYGQCANGFRYAY
ncbi:hypothetical protein [Desulfosporosinus hippei]|uniref:Uncharacterized protein n=1 Tax=Desulfosporosinus hippei DSM 8344 TaxID=1121419 RepID=A0A1G8H2H4_9FIRM|nr:hypothetical protein [Desulfosporosinus hippei]SDI00751.1 hypothetical protein SAMN05443529_12427 [Desulfosporosinus hippei DSM 8344]